MLSMLLGLSVGALYWFGWALIVVFVFMGVFNIARKNIPRRLRIKRSLAVLIVIIVGAIYMHFVGIASAMYCKSLVVRMQHWEPTISVCTIGIYDTGMQNFLINVKERDYTVAYIGWGYMIIEDSSKTNE